MEQLNKADLIAIRNGVLDDKNFILATMLRGLYYGETAFSEMDKSLFMSNYHGVVEKLLACPSTTVRVACLKEDPGTILGYVIYREAGGTTVLDYVFVKSAWRHIGIAKSLVPLSFSFCTHLTKIGRSLKPESCSYNPFLL
jgi:hypothetical protein